MNSNSISKLDKVMTTEQFSQVVEAILDGKYSWACVLILRFAGYNPLHYIPYRTYNRLMKEHKPAIAPQQRELEHSHPYVSASSRMAGSHSSKIADLNYLEAVEERPAQIRGGDRSSSWTRCNLFNSISIFSERN